MGLILQQKQNRPKWWFLHCFWKGPFFVKKKGQSPYGTQKGALKKNILWILEILTTKYQTLGVVQGEYSVICALILVGKLFESNGILGIYLKIKEGSPFI